MNIDTPEKARLVRYRDVVEVFACNDCNDTRMVEAGENAVKPCVRCNRDAYERWANGRYLPENVGHDVNPRDTKTRDRERFA